MINNFQDEQFRIMKMRNNQFENNKKDLLQKIYKIENGSNFFKQRSGIGGTNPILRFLSDEKSILLKHLQSSDVSPQISKDNLISLLLEKNKNNLSLTPKRDNANSLNPDKN